MALPTFSAPPPDMSHIIAGARDRANALMESAWMGLGSIGQKAQAGPVAAQDINWGKSETGAPAQGAAGVTGSDDWASAGFADNVPRSLIGTESGGRWDAYNDVKGSGGIGHDGILQFSQGRRAEAVAAGVIPQMTREEFRANKQAQVAAANWHFNDIDNRIRKAGFDRYVGQTINGTPVSWDGMRSMAHLGGFGGLSSFIRSGGAHNPADAYGTSLSAYGTTHSR